MKSLLLMLACFMAGTASAGQVRPLAEMTSEQLRVLDRERTAIVIPGGILEEHGPYLPVYTDGYNSERVARDVATAIAGRDGWTVLVFPQIPLGSEGANMLGGKPDFPGTFAVAPDTLRTVYTDLADQLGRQGFRWIFLVNIHGSPLHNKVLDEAGESFRTRHGGRMVNLYGLLPVEQAWETAYADSSEADLAENGFCLHACAAETATILHLRPDLVPANVKQAPPVTARNMPDVLRIAAQKDWPGYFGSPRLATPEMGRRAIDALSAKAAAVALRILDGDDERDLGRIADRLPPPKPE